MDRSNMRALLLFIVLISLISLFPVVARAEKRIGIFTFHEEVRYNEAKNGILDQLKKAGYEEPAVKYTIENAQSSKAKAAEIVRKFAAAKMDLIITIGASATIPITREIKDVPVVFSMVFDPIGTGVAKDWKSSGNNTTGVSSRVPASRIADTLNAFAPIKRLAVLYTPGEINSETHLMEVKKIENDFQIKIIPIILTNKEEIDQTLSEVIRTADALYLTGSTIIGETVPIIVDMANKAKVVTITHLDDLVEKGVLLGVCPDSHSVGILSGKKAVKILKGAKPSSIPIEIGKKLDVILNKKTAKAGKFQIPPAFMKTVTKTIE